MTFGYIGVRKTNSSHEDVANLNYTKKLLIISKYYTTVFNVSGFEFENAIKTEFSNLGYREFIDNLYGKL